MCKSNSQLVYKQSRPCRHLSNLDFGLGGVIFCCLGMYKHKTKNKFSQNLEIQIYRNEDLRMSANLMSNATAEGGLVVFKLPPFLS